MRNLRAVITTLLSLLVLFVYSAQTSLAAGQFNWKCPRGDTFTRVINWTDLAGNPINVTGCSVQMPVKASYAPDAETYYTFSTTAGTISLTNAAQGQVTINVPASITSGFTFTSGVATVIFTFPDNTVKTLLYGNFSTYYAARETGKDSMFEAHVAPTGDSVTVATIGIQGPPGVGGGGSGGGLANPMTATGDIIFSSDNTGTPSRLAGNTTSTPKFYMSQGTGSAAQAPTVVQPLFSHLGGTANASQLPSTAANSVTGLSPLFNAAINAQALSFSQQNANANSWFGNATSSSAAPLFNTTVLPNSLVNWAAPSAIGSTTPAAGTFTGVSVASGSFKNTVQSSTLTANRAVTLPDGASNPVLPLGSASAHNWVQYVGSDSVQHLSQPSFADVAGTATTGQLPAAAVFGPQSASSHQFYNGANSSGVLSSAQPGFSDLSGLIAVGQLPATTVDGTGQSSLGFVPTITGPNTYAWQAQTGGAGGGSVTSVGMLGDGVVFQTSVTNSPVTTTGNLTPVLNTIAAHRVLGNNTGSTATIAAVQLGFSDLSGAATVGQLPATAALTTSSNSFTANQTPSAAGGQSLGTGALPWSSAFFGASATNNTHFLPAIVTAARVFSTPDADSNSVIPSTLSSHNFATGVTSGGVLQGAQPSFSDVSGTASAGQLPTTAVNSVSGLSPLFSASIVSQALSFTQSTAAANSWFGNATGSVAAPSFNTSVLPNALVNFAAPSAIGNTTPAAGTFTTVSIAKSGFSNQTTSTALTASRTHNLPNADSNPIQPLTSGTAGSHVAFIDSDGVQHISADTGSGGGFTNPMTTLGDTLVEDATPAPNRIAGNTSTTPKYFRSVGTGSAANAQTWAQPAFSEISGSVSTGQLPSAAVIGPQSLSTHFFGNAINSSGALTGAQPAFSDLSGSATAAQLPTTVPIGPQSVSAHNFFNALSALGVLSGAQPAFTDLSGSATSGQLPTTTVFGPQSLSSHQFFNALSSAGALTGAQPASTDLSDASNVALKNNANSWSADQTPATAGSNALGTTAKPFSKIVVGNAATNATDWVGGTTTATRHFTTPDADSNSVIPTTATSHQFLTNITSGSVQTKAQPAFSDISGTAAAAQLPTFTSSAAGVVPASGGGTTTFARADGTWAVPPGTGGGGGSGLTNGGAQSTSFTATASNYYQVTGTATCTLPTAASVGGSLIGVQVQSGGTVTFATTSGQVIVSSSNHASNTIVDSNVGDQWWFISDGTNWDLQVMQAGI